MSNYLAIATVTATLQRTLQRSVQIDVDGVRVTTTRPENTGGTPESGVSLYLYHIKRNTALANADMPPRQRKGELLKRNQIPIDLYYLISFYGNDVELEPQRLLGSTIKALEDRAVLSSKFIQETVSDPSYPFLANSDLAEQIEMIRAEFVPISTDELSKVWSVFFQTPYALSVVYKITVVVLEGEEPAGVALPVRDRRASTLIFSKQPAIDSVMSAEGRYQPIFISSTLIIRGRMLANAISFVRIDGVEVRCSATQETEISVPLSLIPLQALRAGVQSLQIVHGSISETQANLGDFPQRLESNVVPFVLRPRITEVNLIEVEGSDDEPRDAEIEVVTDVIVNPEQRALLMLNEQTTIKPVSYLFNAQPRDADATHITFKVKGIKPGEYLIRIQVDGAESPLEVERNSNSPMFERYINPSIIIP